LRRAGSVHPAEGIKGLRRRTPAITQKAGHECPSRDGAPSHVGFLADDRIRTICRREKEGVWKGFWLRVPAGGIGQRRSGGNLNEKHHFGQDRLMALRGSFEGIRGARRRPIYRNHAACSKRSIAGLGLFF
jgi:hypothetical protein